MSDDSQQQGELKEPNGAASPVTPSENGAPVTNGASPPDPLTNGAVTRNKRVCRRKAAYKDDYTTKAANQVKVNSR